MNIHEKQFEQMQGISTYWFNKSSDLHSSARVLWKAMDGRTELEIRCYATYKMLMGMSYESMLKAFCIEKDVAVKTTHNLTTLASDAGFSFAKEENKILQVLTDYILWAGKYPTPKPKNGPNAIKKHWEELHNLGYEAFDFDSLHSIWRKMSDEYMDKYNKT